MFRLLTRRHFWTALVCALNVLAVNVLRLCLSPTATCSSNVDAAATEGRCGPSRCTARVESQPRHALAARSGTERAPPVATSKRKQAQAATKALANCMATGNDNTQILLACTCSPVCQKRTVSDFICRNGTISDCYKRVKGRNHTVEKRISMHPHKPHATSQSSRFSHTHRLSTDCPHN